MPLDPYDRNYNFQQEADSGVSDFPEPGKVDTELNDIASVIAQLRARLQLITSADGRLRNVAYSLAQSLVGTYTGTSAGSATIDTAIPYQATFSVNSLLILTGTTTLRPDQISSVSNNAGNLRVVLASAPANGTSLVVWAFEPGNNVLTVLASAANADGASRIAIEDAASLYTAVTVEAALAEVRVALNALITSLGTIGGIFRANGSVPATANFAMAGFKVTGAADGSADGDYITVRQLAGYIAAWSDLSQFFLKRDGTTAMAGAMNYGNNKGTNLADADLAVPTDAVNVRTMLSSISTGGAVPVGTVIDYVGATAPTSWLICDGTAYAEADYPALADVVPVSFKSGSAQGARPAKYPKLVSGNLTAGVLTSLPALTDAGVGYVGIPDIEVINPTTGDPVSSQPVFTVTVSPVVTDGPNVTGGSLTISIASGGTGILAGAVIRINNALDATPGSPALATLPGGYFRVPDLRGRVTLGAGTESDTPGIVDPPDVTRGDAYNASTRALGEYGGTEKHRLTEDELPSHRHGLANYGVTDAAGNKNAQRDSDNAAASAGNQTGPAGTDVAHNTMPPFGVLNKIIKAS